MIANLNDTYACFKRESEGSKDVLQEIETLAQEYQGPHEPLDVSKRNISVYRELTSERERVVT